MALNDNQQAFGQWLAKLDTSQQECRGWGHQWPSMYEPETTFTRSRTTGRVIIEMECLRGCGVMRRQHLGQDGVLDGRTPNTYDYPDGYQFKSPTRTAGRSVPKEYRAAIRALVLSEMMDRVPPGRIRVVD